MDAILILLPSRHIPLPRGNEISSSLHVSEDVNRSFWSESMMRQVHACLVEFSGVRVPAPCHWQGDTLLQNQSETKGRRGNIGDGGMYM